MGSELFKALRRPGGLQGHGLDLLYGVGALLYLGLEVVVALVFYRLFLWDWLSGFLPTPAVTALGGLLGAGMVLLNAASALHDLYGARAPSAQG